MIYRNIKKGREIADKTEIVGSREETLAGIRPSDPTVVTLHAICLETQMTSQIHSQ